MKTFGNILWLLCGGLMTAFSWFVIGFIFYITIIGIPIAYQCFKFGELTLTPFGREVRLNFDKYPILNIIWLIFIGIWGFAAQALFGVFLIITIFGIPFGLQYFKLAKLTLVPFGAQIVNAK